MKKTVMVVDDSQLSRNFLLSKLDTFYDVELIESESAKNALSTLDNLFKNNQKVSLILTDINMPEVSGIELIQMLREDDRFKNIPVVIISTKVGTDSLSDKDFLKTVDVIVKPIERQKLDEVLEKYLGKAIIKGI